MLYNKAYGIIPDVEGHSYHDSYREKDDDSNRAAKRRLRQLRVRIAIGVVVSLAVVSLLIGVSAVRKRKKRGLPHAASDRVVTYPVFHPAPPFASVLQPLARSFGLCRERLSAGYRRELVI